MGGGSWWMWGVAPHLSRILLLGVALRQRPFERVLTLRSLCLGGWKQERNRMREYSILCFHKF